jgi:putative transposase
MDFAKEHRVRIHSTNVLERLNGEIKQHANVVAIFPNELPFEDSSAAPDGAERRHAIQNRYMSLESLALLGENPTIRAPAAPALA